MIGPPREVINEERATNWMEAKTGLIKEFKDLRPYEDFISDIYGTPYQ